MSRRKLIVDLVLLAFIGLIIQGFWAYQIAEPTYMDGYYYSTNGQRIAQGEGFTELVIWQYLDKPEALPVPSHTYWMPLTSILAAAGYLLKDNFRGAQLLFWFMSGLLPVLTYLISRILSGERWQAWTAALLAAAGGYYAAFLPQPTTFAPFAWAGASCLLLSGLSTSQSALMRLGSEGSKNKNSWAWILILFSTGITAGLAHLTRADGLLLLIIALALWLIYGPKLLRNKRILLNFSSTRMEKNSRAAIQVIAGAAAILAGYLAIVGLWFIRNWLVSGTPLPVGGAQSLFLTTYDDIFAYGREVNISSYLDWGWTNIVRSKIDGVSISIQTYIAVVGMIFLFPFVIVGAVSSWRKADKRAILRPALWYALALFLVMSLLFTFPGIRGSLFHSSIALWPWSMTLAAVGIGASVDWIASRLSHWQADKAKRRFSAMFVLMAFVISLVISLPRSQESDESVLYKEAENWVPESAVVVTGNAPSFFYHTGRASINVPNEPPGVLLEVAKRYGASYLLLDSDHPQPLVDLYHGTSDYPGIELLGEFNGMRLYMLKISES